MERELWISPQPNWIQRYIIQKETIGRKSNEPTQPEKEFVDPLESVKQHYFQVYLEETSWQSVAPETSSAIRGEISWFVEATANTAYEFYDSHKTWIFQNIPHFAQTDMKQFLNHLAAEISHNDEKILEAWVKYIAENDQLSQTKAGRIIRLIKPSEKRKQLDQVFSLAKRDNENVAKQFRDEIIGKYRR